MKHITIRFATASVFVLITATFLSLQGYSPVAAQNAGSIDLALVIDGSGSISADDFALQKEGLKAALENTLIFPRNSSISVTVIQFANATTYVHIPYTVIDSDAAVTNLLNQVDGIVQIGGSTNPGDGINSANNVFNASGNSSNKQVICMSTDGLPNSGADVPTALTTARNSNISLDKFSVIAIEDPPLFYEPDFQNYYGPLVFGGGAVTVVRNSVEYANILGATCLPANLELVGLEVIQTIQNWNNSVPLIENKTTYVRAHIQTINPQDGEVIARARLRGYRNGVELNGSPLTAEAPGYIIAKANAAQRRGVLNDSLNFRLPHDWLNGTVELRIEGGSLICHESAGTPDDCRVSVTFNRTDRLEVEFVGVEWSENGSNYELLPGHYSELAERLRAIYPIASDTTGLDWRWDEMRWDSPLKPILLSVLARLELMQASDLCFSSMGCQRIYYGVLRGPSASNIGGLAIIGGHVSTGFLPDDAFVYGRNRHAHEIGHNLGRREAVHGPLIDPTIFPFDEYKEGWCGEVVKGDAEEFPISGEVAGMTVATIGALNVENDAILFGFDSNIIQDTENRNLAVIDPREHFELMSYCGSPNLPFPHSTFRWISEHTYGILRSEINSRFNAANVTQVGDPISYLAIRGLIDDTNNTVEFLPFSQIFSASPITEQDQGEYILRLSDELGNIVSDIAFQPNEIAADSPEEDPRKKIFLIVVPANADIYQARILHGNELVGELSRSQNSPTVNLIYPNGGEFLSGENVVLTWTSDDLDGDTIYHVIQYSRDGGTTWETLTADWPQQTYQVNLSELGESDSGLIKVIASDGFNVVSDTSDSTFTTPNNPPEAYIYSPFDGQTFIGVENVALDGSAVDGEEGQLLGSNLAWTSNLDGFLGIGDNLLINASQLSEGNHTISLTATDSGGLASTASVNVAIYRLGPPSSQAPGEFIKIYPLSGAPELPTNVILSWGTSDGATSYEYCYDTTNDNSCNWIDNGLATTVRLTGLSPSTTYYWHVRALNSNGTRYSNGSNSAFWPFTTITNLKSILYMTEREGTLRRVDQLTGATTTVGTLGTNSILGLSNRPGDTTYIYGVYVVDLVNSGLAKIDTLTGQATLLPLFDASTLGITTPQADAIAISPTAPNIAVVAGFSINSGSPGYLWKVDADTGIALGPAIPTTEWIYELAYSPEGSVLYGVNTHGQLMTVDSNTGATTVLGEIGQSLYYEGLAFRPSDGELFAIDGQQNDRLVRINPVNGELLEIIGNLGVSAPNGLAFIPSYKFDVSRPGTGNGVILSDPSGIQCGSTCSYEFNANTPVTVIPAAYDDSDFTSWGGDCAGIDTCTVTMTRDMSVTANFDYVFTNLLKNSSFETDDNKDNKPDLWSTNAKFTSSTETPEHGTYVGRFYATDNSGATIQQVVQGLSAGSFYDFSSWVKIPYTTDPFTFKLQVKWRNASNTVISTEVIQPPYTGPTDPNNNHDGWDYIEYSLVAPSGTTNALVQMVVSSLNGTIYVDHFLFGSTPPINDVTPPSVSWIAPVGDYQVYDVANEIIRLEVNATDDVGVSEVVFYRWDYVNLVNVELGRASSAPYAINFDTSSLLSGQNEINAFAYDAAGNSGNSTIWLNHITPDLIFANSFEDDDCFTTEWTACVDNAGDLHFDPPPDGVILKDGSSMVITIDDNNAVYVRYDHAIPEPRYRARFYFRPVLTSILNGNLNRIFYGYSGTSKVVLRVEFRQYNNNYQLRAGLLTDASSWINSPWVTIDKAVSHYVEFDWRAATAAAANNGGLTLWIDGVQKYNRTTVDNDTFRITSIRLGAVNGIDTGTRGRYYFDAFESRRQTYIGP